MSILDDTGIKFQQAKDIGKSIDSEELKPISLVFAKNVDELWYLLNLPVLLLTVASAKAHHLAFFAQALVKTNNVTRWKDSPEARQEVFAEVKKMSDDAWDSPSEFDPVKEGEEELSRILETNTEVLSAARALLYAGASLAWTSFECAIKDAWIAALNARPIQLAQPTLRKISDEPGGDGLTGKQIAVGLLARHGFDIRDKLGTLLAAKFDFTGVSGIRNAYAAAFRGIPEIEQALMDPKLGLLEATRHLIVHRAGVIDDEYKRRTDCNSALGGQLEINGAQVGELSNAAISAVCKVLLTVDKYLVSNPPQSQ